MTEEAILLWLDMQSIESGRATVVRALHRWLRQDGRVPLGKREKRKPLTKRQKLELLVKQDMRCARCGGHIDMTTASDDHTVPIARGGGNDIGNRRLLCGKCNSSKGSRDPVAESKRTGQTILDQL